MHFKEEEEEEEKAHILLEAIVIFHERKCYQDTAVAQK